MAEREKVSGFRLPEYTLNKLDELVSWGIIRNRTDAIIDAVNEYYTRYQFDRDREPFLHMLNHIIMDADVVRSFKHPDAVFPVRMLHGYAGSSTINRISPTHANIHMYLGQLANMEVIIDVRLNILDGDGYEEYREEDNDM